MSNTPTGVTYKQLEQKADVLNPWITFVTRWEGSEIADAWLSLEEAAEALISAADYSRAMAVYSLFETMIQEGRADWFDEWVEGLPLDGRQEYAKLTGKPMPRPEREVWEVTLVINCPAQGTPIGDHSLANSPDKWNFDMMLNEGQDAEGRSHITTANARRVS